MKTAISLAVDSATAIKDLARALINESDRQKATAIEIDLAEKVLHIHLQLSDVLTASIAKDAAHDAQTQRIAEIEAAQRQKERYRLAKVGVGGDFFAYELKPQTELLDSTHEPEHFVCHPCLDIRNQRIALNTVNMSNRPYRLVCPGCGANIPLA